MKDLIRIMGLEDREPWQDEHLDGGLPSQSWSYAWGLSASGVLPKLAVVQSKESRMLIPFFERRWMGSTDIATVFGLSGASIASDPAAPLGAWRELARSKGWVAGYIQLSAFNPNTKFPTSEPAAAGNDIFLLDLRRGDLTKSASRIIKRKIHRASSAGTVLVEDRAVLADSLKRLHPLTADRVGAQSHYRFTDETLERWALDPASLVLGAKVEGSIEAVCIFLVAGNKAEYHIIGSTEAGRELTAWLMWKGTARLREMGVDILNLGGGVHAGDGICEFKERLGGIAQPQLALKQIYDPKKYCELCEMAENAPSSNWFPAYRSRAN